MLSLDANLILDLASEVHITKVSHLSKLVRAANGPLIFTVSGYKDVEKWLGLKPRATIGVLNDLEHRGWISRVWIKNRLCEIHIHPQSLKAGRRNK